MDKELIEYIITHCMELLGLKEKTAQRHHMATIKPGNANDSQLKDMTETMGKGQGNFGLAEQRV